MGQVITKTQLAQQLGLTQARISQYLKSGMPERPDGKLDAVSALAWIESHVDRTGHRPAVSAAAPLREPGQAPAAPPDPRPLRSDYQSELFSARIRKALADARRSERIERQHSGDLLERQKVLAHIAGLIGLFKDALLSTPDRLQPRLAAATPEEIHSILHADANATLLRLSKAVRASGLDQPGPVVKTVPEDARP